jgi:Protein of unknown function (DUF4038)/Concanavalin A-like lectin/glucanases superfamily/Putative collagen-binding domain of a collagenase/Bacterial Ig domain
MSVMENATRHDRVRLLFLAAVVSLASSIAAAAGVAYPLTKSPNGRYLVDQNNVPYLMVGDSPQALIVNISEADAEMYFADRQAHGFNTLWINLLSTYTGTRPLGSTLDGIVPFTATLSSTSSYDLGTPNEAYFAHVDRILGLAANHGLQVLLDPIETSVLLPTILDNGATRCRAYGRYLGNRYKNVPNIVWMSGNDFQTWQDAASDADVRAVALGILDNDTNHLHTVELNYLASSSLDDSTWTSILGLNATYTYYPSYSRLLQDYARSAFLPNFLVEANYEFEALQGPMTTAAILRKQEYWAMTSGAAGQLYGNHYTWPFSSGWKSYLDTPGAIQMGYLVALFAPRAWYDLVPDTTHALVTAGYGTSSASGYVSDNNYATAARTPDGSLAIVYTPILRTLTVDMSKLGGVTVSRWYDPSNGAYVAIAGSPFPNTGNRTFTPPGNNGDGDGGWVLLLETTPLESQPPIVALTAPSTGVVVSDAIPVSAVATDNVGVVGVQFQVDGVNLGSEVTSPPYATTWDTLTADNGAHVVSAIARDLAGNRALSSMSVTTSNPIQLRLATAYAFNEAGGTTTSDASGNGNTGVLHGVAFAAGRNGNALTFNGSSSYVETPNSASLDIGGRGLTIAFWVKVNSTSSGKDYVIVEKPCFATTMTAPYYQYGVEYSNGGNKSLDFSFADPSGTRHGPFRMNSPAGVWTHAAFTYDGNTVTGYVNGVATLSIADVGSIQARGNSLRLGVDGAYQQFFNGSLDDLRIYGRALTQLDVQSLMQAPVGAGPGAVPDGGSVVGIPLAVGKGAAAGTLDLTWGASCSGTASNYEVYEGTLPIAGTYNHIPLNCNLGNVTATNITPAAGPTYYLIVAETAASEGSYGTGLIGGGASNIPQGEGACYPQQLSACP